MSAPYGRSSGTGKQKTPVIATLKDGTEKQFESQAAAGVALGVKQMDVSRCVRGVFDHVNGIRFRFADPNYKSIPNKRKKWNLPPGHKHYQGEEE